MRADRQRAAAMAQNCPIFTLNRWPGPRATTSIDFARTGNAFHNCELREQRAPKTKSPAGGTAGLRKLGRIWGLGA
jgi:hypothetical protein